MTEHDERARRGVDDRLGLGLGYDERPRPRRRALGALGRFVLFLAVLAVLAAIPIGLVRVLDGHLPSFGGPPAPDYAGDGSGSVVVRVEPGDTATDIAKTLLADGVVKSTSAFTIAARDDSRSTGIQPGYYRLHQHMSGQAALALMLDSSSRVQTSVTIPEGSTTAQVVALLAHNKQLTTTRLKAAVAHPSALGLPSWGHGKVEGFLFPATYTVDPGTTATSALKAMVTKFDQVATTEKLTAGAAALHESPYDVLRIASIVEKEAGLQRDFAKVARVIDNRLRIGMRLQVDSTLEYVLPQRKGTLTNKDLQFDSPYNTYQHTGLPPTPISNPGQAALHAALHPANGNWLYFVTIDKQGHTAFTSSYSQFLHYKAEATRNGVIK